MPTPTRAEVSTAERQLAGSVLAGRYELRALLGRGGMGEVYEAADLRLDRTVAVKVLRPELAADRRFVGRFRREARTAARLAHPGIVSVFDAGEDRGLVYIVMAHVAGSTLADLVRSQGRFSPARAAAIGADVAEALAHAHTRGVVHRDVNPGNVMLGRGDRTTVLDFGIAHAAHGSVVASSTTVHGTVAYAAPEVLEGAAGDQQVDVYGLGAVLYELLTGAPPFRGSDERDVARRLRVLRPVPVRGWSPGVPDTLDGAVLRCLARFPSERPSDLDAFARELRGLAVVSPTTAPTAPVAVVGASTPTATSGGPHTPALPDRTRQLPVNGPRPRPPAEGRTAGRLGRAAAWVALIAAIVGAVAVALPPIVALTRPVRASVIPPPVLPAPDDLAASTSCDGWLSTAAELTWSSSEGAAAYEVWRQGTGDASFELVGTVDASVTAVREPDLGVDTTYRYRVRAIDEPRVGAWSSVVEARTPLLCLT